MMKVTVSVTDFGGIANSKNIQTDAFQKAIDYCFLKKGGGEVIVPEGEYITGDIRLRSNITLHLLKNAKILGSHNPKDYQNIYNDQIEPLSFEQATKARWIITSEWLKMGGGFKRHLYTAGSYWNYGIIRAVYAENIAIIGEEGAVINGRNVYDPEGEEQYRGPHAINMHFCKNLKFAGYTVINAGNWAHAVFQSENINFNNITVLGGHDGIHTRACDNVTLTNCRLITGDDCVAGFNNNDVLIKNCELSSACSAFRFGGNNILIEDCRAYGPCEYQFRGGFTDEEKALSKEESDTARNNMLCFYTNFVTDDLPLKKTTGNIKVKNCTVSFADRFFHMNLSGNESWQRGNPPTDITFENIKAQGIKTGIYAYGIESVPFNLKIKNFDYSFRECSESEDFIKGAYIGEINIENTVVNNYKGDSFIKVWSDDINVIVKNLKCNIKDNGFVVRATEEFECDPI